jgi:SET domain-containing protein
MHLISSRRPFRLGRSRTGFGLFATKPIKKGTFIIRYWGPRISNAKADALDNRYLFEIGKRWTIDGSPRRNIARYINHSCRPNAESDVVKGKILISAIKHIAPGDEITYDYGRDHFNGFIKPKGCQCDKCRQRRREERAAARAKAKRAKHRAAKRGGKTNGRG